MPHLISTLADTCVVETMSKSKCGLTCEYTSSYSRYGYAVLPEVVPPHELELLCCIFDRLFVDKVGRDAGDMFDLAGQNPDSPNPQVPQLLFPSKYAPQIKELRCWANVLSIAMELLDVGQHTADQLIVRDHAIVKPPGALTPTPWHQDEAYWEDDQDYNELSVWIPLQQTTVQMGCLQFVPGSHLGEVYPHHHPGGADSPIVALEVDDGYVEPSKVVACPLGAGQATVHHSRTLHYADGNATQSPRRAFIMTVGTPPTKRPTPRNFYWNRRESAANSSKA